MNPSGGQERQWVEPNRTLRGGAFAPIRRVARSLAYPVQIALPASGMTLLGGWAKPGSIVVRAQSAFASGSSGEPDRADVLLLIDGDPAPDTGGEPIQPPHGTLLGMARETFPALVALPTGEVLCAYAIEGRDGILFCRTIGGGLEVGPAYPVVNLRAQSGVGDTSTAIFGPVFASGVASKGIWAAFWCGGKILAARIDTVRETRGLLEPLVLVAGGRNFTTTNNKAHAVFAQMQSNKHLYVNQGGIEEEDIPNQSPGLVVSEKHPTKESFWFIIKTRRVICDSVWLIFMRV